MSAHFSKHSLALLGSSHVLPGPAVDNQRLLQALADHCGKKAARQAGIMVRRLGIESRHLSRDIQQELSGARPGMTAPELCARAIERAAGEAGIDIRELDYYIGHTTSPHTLLPPNIAWVAQQTGFTGPYLELRQACTGFANGLQIAASMIAAEGHSAIAVVGSETGSTYFSISPEFLAAEGLQREQLVNFVQMGDGAGCVILGPDQDLGRGILSDLYLGHLGPESEPGFYLQGGGSEQPFEAAGFPVFRHRMRAVKESGPLLFHAGIQAIQSRGYQLGDFRWILPHQANGHIAREFAKALAVPKDQVYVTADRLGNLGSAAIWVSFDQLLRSQTLEPGDKVLVLGAEATKYMYGGFVYTH